MFKVNNENIRTTSMTYFIPFSSVFIAEFEKVLLLLTLNK